MLKKLNAGLILLALTLFSCRNLTDDDTYSSEAKKVQEEVTAETLTLKKTDLYYLENGVLKKHTGDEACNLYFTAEGDIPYVEVESFLKYYTGNDYPVSREGCVYKIARKQNTDYYFTIDFSNGKIIYSDHDHFYQPINEDASFDVITDYSNYKRRTLVDIKGANVSYSTNLKDYNIPLLYESNNGFIPVSTLISLLYKENNFFIYNGKDAFVDNGNNYMTPAYSAKIANPEKTTYSDEFAEYSYNNLCFVLDMNYGRKEYLGVSSFDSWISAAGLKEALSSTDMDTSERALGRLIYQNIADIHTYYVHWTPFEGLNPNPVGTVIPADCLYIEPTNIVRNPSYTRLFDTEAKLKTIRQTCRTTSWSNDGVMNIFIPNKAGGAKDNTIFLCFDGFESSYYTDTENYQKNWKYDLIGAKGSADGVKFYKSTGGSEDLTEDQSIADVDAFIERVKAGNDGYGIHFSNPKDTILLTIVSNYIIKKLNTDTSNDKRPIANVVLDLSLNGGGANDDETFLASWFLDRSIVGYVNKTTGSKSAVEYLVDVNFDGEYNTDDKIEGLNRYAITSHYSFSCGNLLPAQIYFSDNVKTFGQKSGGGTCCIIDIVTPSGTAFSTSSAIQMSTFINGSFVDIDAGIDVDISIPQMDFGKVYDRVKFCEEYLKD